MNQEAISGDRQYEFVKRFHYTRVAGTKEEQKTAAGILEELEERGLKGVEETFEFPVFEMCEEIFEVTEPYHREYRVTGYRGCENTPPDGVEAPFFYAENGDTVNLSDVRGRIVMVNGRVPGGLCQKLREAGAVGFVSITGSPVDEGEDLAPAVCRSRGAGAGLSGVNLHYKDAVELVERGACRARLKVRQQKVIRTSQNIVMRIEGNRRPEEILTVSAHYDSVSEGPGAYDNLAGASVVMELAGYFTQNPPGRTIEFIWFGAEEAGLRGSRAYVDAHKEELKAHCLNMNIDLAGQIIGGNNIGVTAEPSVCQVLSGIMYEEGLGGTVVNGLCGSDSNSFAWSGVPGMTINRDGFGMHTRHDSIALISPWALRRSTLLLGTIAQRLANAAVLPFSREIPKEYREQLDEYFSE